MYLCLTLYILLYYIIQFCSCDHKTIVYTSDHSKHLAETISNKLSYTLGNIKFITFSDGEIKLLIEDDLTGSDVIIVQSTRPDLHKSLIELLFMISTAKKEGANNITVLAPYLCYSRQHLSIKNGETNSSEVIAKIIEALSVNRLITLDPHSLSINNFYTKTQFEYHLVSSIAAKYFVDLKLENVVVVAPDEGAKVRASKFLEEYNTLCNGCGTQSKYVHSCLNEKCPKFSLLIKYRSPSSGLHSTYLTGSPVKDKNVIIVDDMIDTGGTIVKSTEVLKTYGANKIYVFATHGIFSGNAVENLNNSQVEKVVVTNSIQQPKAVNDSNKIEVLDVSEFLANLLESKPQNSN